MKVAVDMNLSPEWVPLLRAANFEAVHWSTTGNPKAEDHEIIESIFAGNLLKYR